MISPQEENSHLSAKPLSVATDTLLQTPLSKRGAGPGLLLIVPRDYQGRNFGGLNETLDPEPLQKWAEEGFAVAEVRVGAGASTDAAIGYCGQAIQALTELPQCTSKEKVGVIAHTRTLGFLRAHLGGPHFNLEAIWDEHCLFEFGERDVEKTMSTMVAEPYVNHIPTLTGGIGRKALTAFYRDHFIFNNPEDTQLELISRTVGTDRVIDEFIFRFTHDKVIDWLVPGIPPTQKNVRVPFTSVVNVRGDRLYHEHIAWDQASVLRQLGLLPEYLPFPYPLPDGRVPAKGKRFEYRVPAAGVDTARKLADESSVVSNEMLGFEIREVDDV
ncbi:hypothetical protein BKA61DRAFT_616852 [Leptodontidium sp. MPI-SDFR-AT-0119]|nr:hypothetical protein BKA61DRAFT_616852 [Leptodontidium sp. MPI-SDFR-AT-0119]